MSETIYHIYDKIFKKILTLSSTAVVNLINGLFDTDYSPDSTVTYNWTEFVDGELRHVLADTILTIGTSHSYHLEAQMTGDEDIIFRVFEYGYRHADRSHENSKNGKRLLFPEPRIIYLTSGNAAPDEYKLTLDFGSQGTFLYKVPACKFQEISLEELNRRKMIILIPFQLLKLKKLLDKERSEANLETLKNLINHDIIETIENNLRLGNITEDDARKLKRLTHRLYAHLYSHYREMEALNEMTDESLMLDIDIIEKRHEEELAAKDREIAAKDKALSDKDKALSDKDKALSDKENELAELRARLAALQADKSGQ